ncbi:sugar phosphate isomerase/epimerase family protein [Paenibacillus lautus]|jgi:sugar phosphate isomerase/epimerase|uniref:sugar phosphate isomerase/epimerase family protein n=1 Tax=Paenibacillus lautus TaxID=1401 RepID=UPI0026EDBAF2|nr:sugar phosphate isomerase/epimerase family protein [Paenibacillus lautus]MCI1774946.1 sugar phosphate isomerase/epimerase [Paenibacillus lautus]
MITLTGFADEISRDLEEQLDVLESESIRYLELRGVWGKNVLQLTEEELSGIKERLSQRGVGVSSIGSPIGKIQITDDFEPHLEHAKHAVRLAKYFQAPYVRVFSFYIPDGDHEKYRPEVIRRMLRLAQLAEQEGIVLLHENESHIYGDTGERCLELLQSVSSPHLRAAFDPANFVQCGVKPVGEAYPLVGDYTAYIHVKDAMMGKGMVVPAGDGDGELRLLLQELCRRRYSGFLSLEPHLRAAGRFEGFTNPQLFVEASKAIKRLLTEEGMEWN